MRAFSRLSHAPIVLIGDLLMAGPEHAAEVLERLREADFPNEIMFEFFALPPASFLKDIDRSVRHWSMEFSPKATNSRCAMPRKARPAIPQRRWKRCSRKRSACAARASMSFS